MIGVPIMGVIIAAHRLARAVHRAGQSARSSAQA